MTTNNPQNIAGKDFSEEILRFASSIDGLLVTLPGVMNQIYAQHKQSVDEANSSQKNERRKIANLKRCAGIAKGFHLIHRSFLTSQISQYDAYLGRLMRLVYNIHPERVMVTDKQMTGRELLKFRSIEDLRESFISREIDSLLFKSHEDQIRFLEKDFNFKAKEILPELPDFIECAQRRHLFVHCDGVVTERYVKNCKEAEVILGSEIEVGKGVEVSPEYLFKAFETVYLVGVKVGVQIWLNNFKADQVLASGLVNHLGLDLISNERHKMAINLFQFVLSGNQKKPDETMYRYNVLNLAQAYKWSGNQAKCLECIGSLDWSASADLLKLGVAVLRDDFQTAVKIIPKVSLDENFKKENFALWPIFREIRKAPEFRVTYKDVYSEEFAFET
jgi:hypothetical protein